MILIQKVRDYKISLFVITFLITLESFYSYYLSFNIAYVLVLVVLILQALSKIDIIKKKDFRLPNNFLTFFLIIFLLSVISHIYYKPNIEYKFFFKILYALIFIYCLSISIKNENLKSILSIVLLIHSTLLIIQYISFYTYFVQIDFFNLFWGIEQKGAHLQYVQGDESSRNLLRLKRFSGLFNEPGTYCNVIGILSCMLSNFKNLNKLHKIILFISTFSLLLTFSTYGYLFFIIILISYTSNNYSKFNIKDIIKSKFFVRMISLKKNISFKNLIIILIILIFFYYIQKYSIPYLYSRFFEFSYKSGLGLRFFSLIYFFNAFLNDFFLIIAGTGMINETYAYFKSSVTYDNTLLLYLFSRSGIFVLFIYFLLSLYFLKFDKSKLCTFTIIMLSKLSLFSPIILFGLYTLLKNLNGKK
jgi:hypothetical protein